MRVQTHSNCDPLFFTVRDTVRDNAVIAVERRTAAARLGQYSLMYNSQIASKGDGTESPSGAEREAGSENREHSHRPFHPLPVRRQPVMELQIRRHYMPLGNLWFRARYSANTRPVTFPIPIVSSSLSLRLRRKSIRSTSRFYHSLPLPASLPFSFTYFLFLRFPSLFSLIRLHINPPFDLLYYFFFIAIPFF